MSGDSDGDDDLASEDRVHYVLAATHTLGGSTSPDSSLDGFGPGPVSQQRLFMMQPNLSLAGGNSGATRLQFSDNRCGDCQSCNVRKTTGSCKKMGAPQCSGCRDNQKCWRLSPCEFVSEKAKEEFILSQLETKARLERKGPVSLGSLLDRYGYRLATIGRGLEPIEDQLGANPATMTGDIVSLPTTDLNVSVRPTSESAIVSSSNIDNSRIFGRGIGLESTRVGLPRSPSPEEEASFNRTIVARQEKTVQWPDWRTGESFGLEEEVFHPIASIPSSRETGHILTNFAQSQAGPRSSLSATLPPVFVSRPSLRPSLMASAPRPSLQDFDPFSPRVVPTRFPFRPTGPGDGAPPPPSVPSLGPGLNQKTPQSTYLPPHIPSFPPSSSQSAPPPGVGAAQASMNVPAADLSALASSIHQLAQQVAGALSHGSQRGEVTSGLPKAPSVQLIPLTLESSGHLDAITYHTWKLRLRHQIEKLHLQEDVVLHLLLTRQNLLPVYLRDQLLNCHSLAHLLARLDVQAPHLSAALPKLKEKITSLPPSGTSGAQIESRCTELLTALENLNTLFPSCQLGREELLACLSRLGGDEIVSQIHSSLNQWSELASLGVKSLNESLYDFLLTVRSNRVELRVAGELYHHRSAKEKLQLPFAVESKEKSPAGASASAGSGRKESIKKDWSDVKCTICKKFHREARYNCPQIPDILSQKSPIPPDICALCLSLSDSNGRCTNTRKPCHELMSKKGAVSLLCQLHEPKCHFQLCRSCPTGSPRLLGKPKTLLCFGGKLAPRPASQQLPQTPSKASFLQLPEDQSGEVILEATAGLCEILKCFHPGLKKYVDVFCQYDGGGGLSLAQGAEHLDMQPQAGLSELVSLQGLLAQEAGRLPVIVVRVQGHTQRLDISFCVKSFPSEAPDPLMTQIVFKEERAQVVSKEKLREMPKLLFGQRLLKLHPAPLSDDEVPQSFAETWPGVQVYRSKVTGNLLYGGHLAMAAPPVKTVLLGVQSPVVEPSPPISREKQGGGDEAGGEGPKLSAQQPSPPKIEPSRRCKGPKSEETNPSDGVVYGHDDEEQEVDARALPPQPPEDQGGVPQGGQEVGPLSLSDFWMDSNPAPNGDPWRPPPWPPPPPGVSITGEKPSQETLLAHFNWVQAVAEIRDGHGPPLGSLMAGRVGTNGCLQCSPIAKQLSQLVANDQLLKAQLEWNGSGFTFERLHHEWVKFLPSGEKASIAVTRLLIQRLKGLPFTSSWVNYKLEEEFKLGKTRWVDPEELCRNSTQHHFLAPLLIVNLKSTSSPLRLCQNPAAKHKIVDGLPSLHPSRPPPGRLTLNDTVHQYGGTLITPDKFSLFQSTSVVLSAGDVAGAFRQIRLHPNTQLMSLSHKLKSRKGFPSFSASDCASERLHVLADLYAAFGQSDLPFVLTTCLQQASETFEKFAPTALKENINPVIFRQASFILGVLAYIDDLPIITSLRHLLEHQQTIINSSLLATLKDHEHKMDKESFCTSLSQIEWDSFQTQLLIASRCHQQELIRSILKVLSFCGFHLKSIDSSDPTLCNLHLEHHQTCPVPKAAMGREKPAVQEIFRENGGGSAQGASQNDLSPFLVQMSKSLFAGDSLGDDAEGLKTRHLIFSKLKGYGFSGELHDLPQFRGFLEAHQNKITRRLVVSCLSQFYDPRMRHLILPTVLAKCALFHLYRQDPSSAQSSVTVMGWEDIATPLAQQFVLAAVRAFFLICHEKRRRCEIIFHTSALRVLVLLSDTSPMLGANQAFLVTGLIVGGCYQAKVHLLNQKVLLNRPDQKSIPYLELLHVFKNANQNLPLIPWLESQGLGVPRSRVVIATDSSSASLQLKSLFYSEFTLRTNFLCSKTAATMISYGLDPLSHLYHLDQHHLRPPPSHSTSQPPSRKFTFHCDKLTKPPASLTDHNIMKWHREVTSPDWLLLHPREWSHLSRNAFVPKAISKSFLESLQVNPAYLDKIAKRLESLRSSTPGGVMEPAPSSPKSFSQLLSFHNPGGDSFTNTIVKKRQRVLAFRGGAVGIIAKVVFAWTRWRFLTLLPLATRKKLRIERNNLYKVWKNSTGGSPWCGRTLCGTPSSSQRACTLPSSNFGGRRGKCSQSAAQLPHFRFPSYLCCNQCVSNGKALTWGLNDIEENLQARCSSCLKAHFEYKDPIQCKGTSCSTSSCQIQSNVTHLQFTESFNNEVVERASAVQIHSRNKILATLLAHFPFCSSALDTFEELGWDLLASSHLPQEHQCDLPGWSVFNGKVWGGRNLVYAVSRQQRARPVAGGVFASEVQPNGRAVTRLIDPTSEATGLIVRDIHEKLSCADNSVLKYHLLKLGVFFPQANKILEKFRRSCHRCRLRKGRKNKDRDKMIQNLPGPSEELASLFSDISPHSQWMVDHTGHCFITQPDGSIAKHYVLVAVQTLLRRVVLMPVKSLKAVDLLQSLLMLSFREGGIKFVHSDPGSCSKPWASRSSVVAPPLLETIADSNVQHSPWLQLCSDSYTRRLRERNCVFRISGPARSHVQAEVEILVNSIKTYFAHNDENFTNHSNVDIFQFDYILSKIAYFLNSRPLWIWENLAVSSLDLLTAVGRSGPAADLLGLSLSGSLPDGETTKGTRTSVKADVEELSSLTQKLHQNLAYYFLPRLKSPYQPTSYRHRRGDKIEDLQLGAILIDAEYVSTNGACCGALCRLVAWSEGKRMAILVRLKRDLLHDHSFLMKRDAQQCLALHNQPCHLCPVSTSLTPHLEIICRDSQNLYLVANGPPSAPDPNLTQDMHVSGAPLDEPLSIRFPLPEPTSLPRPLCGTPLPWTTNQFVSNNSTGLSAAKPSPRRSKRIRKKKNLDI